MGRKWRRHLNLHQGASLQNRSRHWRGLVVDKVFRRHLHRLQRRRRRWSKRTNYLPGSPLSSSRWGRSSRPRFSESLPEVASRKLKSSAELLPPASPTTSKKLHPRVNFFQQGLVGDGSRHYRKTSTMMIRGRHSWYLSWPSRLSVLSFSQISVLFSIANTNFWHILTNLGCFVANLGNCWCTFTGLYNAVVCQNWQMSGM